MAAVPSIGRASLVEAPSRAPQAAATEGLYERHSAKILSYCLHQLGSREEAEDAVQTTFMNAFRALGRGVVPESESAWLFKIAENVCLSRRRSSWRRGRIESPSDFDVIEEIVPGPSRQRDELIGIEDALASMPEQQRRAILLREWQGLSYREIAGELEVSQSAVETLIFRARRSLAHGLEQPDLVKKPKRKSFRRALHMIDLGTIAAAAKTLLAGSAAVKATAAAVAVTAAAATTAASVKVEGHSPQPAAPPPALVAPAAPKPAAQAVASVAAAAVAVPSTRFVSSEDTATAGSGLARPVPGSARPATAKSKPTKSVASAPRTVPVASAPAAAPEPASVPAEPEQAAPPAAAEPAQPPAAQQPAPPAAEQPKQEKQERREGKRGRRGGNAKTPDPEPAAAVTPVAVALPSPPVAPTPDVPAANEQVTTETRSDRRARKHRRDLAVASVQVEAPVAEAEPAVAPETSEPVAEPVAEPTAEPAPEDSPRGHRGSRRRK